MASIHILSLIYSIRLIAYRLEIFRQVYYKDLNLQYYNNDEKQMKRKVNISVCDIIQKMHTTKNANHINYRPIDRTNPLDSPLVVDKPIRFQDLYKKFVEEHKNGQSNCVKVIYESKKVTPANTHRNKKMSASNSVNMTSKSSNALNSGKSIPKASSQFDIHKGLQKQKSLNKIQNSAQLKTNSKRNSDVRKQSIQKSKKNKQVFEKSSNKGNKQRKQKTVGQKFEECLHQLNHDEHSHLRQRNQCFLSQKQIDILMNSLGYNIKSVKYQDVLTILEVDIYGGVPSQNLKEFIQLIQCPETSSPSFNTNKTQSGPSFKKKLPKIVDNNLKLRIEQENKTMIIEHFREFKQRGIQQKQNHHIMANRSVPKNIQSFEQLLKEKNYFFYEEKSQQKPKQKLYSQIEILSPSKKINSTAISQLIQALSQSQRKNSVPESKITQKVQISNKKLNQRSQEQNQNLGSNSSQIYKQNMETFRKVEAVGFEENGEYNFSRELSGDRILDKSQEQNILELKNRLNEALKRSSSQASQYFTQDRQYNNFLYSNPHKYNRKPILSVDVNLGQGLSQKIIVFQGQTAKEVSERLAAKFTISNETKLKFQKMLQSHLNTMLWKIDELSQEMSTDREPL